MIDSVATLMSQHKYFKVVVPGARFGHVDNAGEARAAEEHCKRETVKLIVRLCKLVEDGLIIRDPAFIRWDLLSPLMVPNSNLPPFNKPRRVQFIECREFTMTTTTEFSLN